MARFLSDPARQRHSVHRQYALQAGTAAAFFNRCRPAPAALLAATADGGGSGMWSGPVWFRHRCCRSETLSIAPKSVSLKDVLFQGYHVHLHTRCDRGRPQPCRSGWSPHYSVGRTTFVMECVTGLCVCSSAALRSSKIRRPSSPVLWIHRAPIHTHGARARACMRLARSRSARGHCCSHVGRLDSPSYEGINSTNGPMVSARRMRQASGTSGKRRRPKAGTARSSCSGRSSSPRASRRCAPTAPRRPSSARYNAPGAATGSRRSVVRPFHGP